MTKPQHLIPRELAAVGGVVTRKSILSAQLEYASKLIGPHLAGITVYGRMVQLRN